MRKLILVLMVLSLFLFAGCDFQLSNLSDEDLERIADKTIVCEKPYIRFASTCCLDANENKICDTDEIESTEEPEEEVEEDPEEEIEEEPEEEVEEDPEEEVEEEPEEEVEEDPEEEIEEEPEEEIEEDPEEEEEEECSNCTEVPEPDDEYCGDSICNGNETCSSCQQDCGGCVGIPTPDHEYRFEQNSQDSIGSLDWNEDNTNGVDYITPSFIGEGSYAVKLINQGFESNACDTTWNSKSYSVWVKPDWSSSGCNSLSELCTIFIQKESVSFQYKHMVLLNDSLNSRYAFSLISHDGNGEYNNLYLDYSGNQNLVDIITSEEGFLLTFTFSDNSENGRTRLYINDQLVGEHAIDGDFQGLTSECAIMYSFEFDNTYYVGEADLFRIWESIELTPEQVKLLWEEYRS